MVQFFFKLNERTKKNSISLHVPVRQKEKKNCTKKTGGTFGGWNHLLAYYNYWADTITFFLLLIVFGLVFVVGGVGSSHIKNYLWLK